VGRAPARRCRGGDELLSVTAAAGGEAGGERGGSCEPGAFNKDGQLGIGKLSKDALRPTAVRIPAKPEDNVVRAGLSATRWPDQQPAR